MSSVKPLIGVPADRRMLGQHAFHCAGEKYLIAVAEGAGAIPVVIPAFGEGLDADALLERLDGVLLTGSPSNVEPHHYAGPSSAPGTLHDPHRDATTLPMIPRIVAAGLPLLAICRGFQEMNVAFGGALHQQLPAAGYAGHLDAAAETLDAQYGPAHEVSLAKGGWLREWARADRITVNSLHAQGIDRLGNGLIVEATAPDGLVEAFRVADAPSFAVAVQWHPEWQFQKNDFSRALFAAFGAAAAQRAQRR